MRSILLTTDQSFLQHSCVLGGPWVEGKAFRSTSDLSLQRCVPLPGYNRPGSQAALANSPLLTLLESRTALNRMQKPRQEIHEACRDHQQEKQLRLDFRNAGNANMVYIQRTQILITNPPLCSIILPQS